MPLIFYLDDYGPVTATVTDLDGTPILPLAGRCTVVNQHTGAEIVTNASCQVASGSMTYFIPQGSPITTTSARYVAYMQAEIDVSSALTVQVPFDVLDRSAYLVVDRWRRKVEFSAPDTWDGSDPISDEEGRDWIDQAVDLINRYWDTGYTSTLASISPAPTHNDIEFIATVASLLARTAWWAGKGEWRDDEQSFSASPFNVEWNRIFGILRDKQEEGWFDGVDDPTVSYDNYNRDRVYSPGVKLDSGGYWWVSLPDDEVPI